MLVPSGPIPRGDNHHDPALPPLAYDPKGARDRLRRAGYRGEPIFLETTAGFIANDKPMAETIAEMWEDVGVTVVIEVIDPATRHVKNRQRTFKGLWWSDPTSILRDPDGMMGRLLSPGSAPRLLAARRVRAPASRSAIQHGRSARGPTRTGG